ncbi:MAG: VWA domain-containing protein [Candidatus Methanomethylophilaceae archaeon]|nr:VWA domain-containing protein [Candidatus Methanomethylophilaceae archaeon]
MDQEHLSGTSEFPFQAVVGADDAKKALIVALVSDDVRTVLIQGGTGSGKTTLVRSLPGIGDRKVVNLPLGTNDTQIFGSIDIEDTILTGERRLMPGLLERADGNILHADDVNLMDHSTLDQVLESVINRKATVEKEGVSREYPCDVTFIGTMNVSENPLPSHLSDRFDICVRIPSSEDLDERYRIVRARVDYDSDPDSYSESFTDDSDILSKRIADARSRLAFVTLPDDIMALIAELCIKAGCEGHRGDIAVANVSKAIAAFDSRDVVTLDDMKGAAQLCLRHRITETPEDGSSSQSRSGNDLSNSEPPQMSADNGNGTRKDSPDAGEEPSGDGDSSEDTVFAVGSTFSVIDFVSLRPLGYMGSSKGGGKHQKIRSTDHTGRYIRSEIPRSEVTDLAFDATIRVAAPYQRYRQRGDLAMVLEKSDLRQKVRERRNGVSIMFLVDASGSMGARKRMVAVKGAVFSLLKESYQNRDKVGLISFRKDRAEILLPFTKSVDFAYKKLKEMPTGGTTPLAAAILKAHLETKKEQRVNPGEKCYVVVTTDGRANVSMSGGDPLKDAMDAATMVGRDASAIWIVVDTGVGYPHLDNALHLSERLNGIYLRLEDLRADSLAHRIKSIVRDRVVG